MIATRNDYATVEGMKNPTPATNKKGTFVYPKFLFLFIQAAGLVWNPDEVAHGIARSAYRIKFLRLDAIHGVAVIPSSPLD